MKIFLHVCCGPCLIKPTEILLAEKHKVGLFFYNPNIHPSQEFRKRLRGAQVAAERYKQNIICDDQYGLNLFIEKTVLNNCKIPDVNNRCETCYRMRLEVTANKARENKADAFSTTLLVSTHQKHEMIKDIGEEVSKQKDIPFYYQDFRPYFSDAQEEAKRMTLYRQQFCGCIFSEDERYRGK